MSEVRSNPHDTLLPVNYVPVVEPLSTKDNGDGRRPPLGTPCWALVLRAVSSDHRPIIDRSDRSN